MKLSICQQFTRHASLWLTDGKVYLVSDVNAGVQVVLGTKKEAYRRIKAEPGFTDRQMFHLVWNAVLLNRSHNDQTVRCVKNLLADNLGA